MARFNDKAHKTDAETQEYVIIIVADHWMKAKDYEAMLKANDIPVAVQEHDEHSAAVMVPNDCLDEAHRVIEAQVAYDNFYDCISEDVEEDFNDLFDDDFYPW